STQAPPRTSCPWRPAAWTCRRDSCSAAPRRLASLDGRHPGGLRRGLRGQARLGFLDQLAHDLSGRLDTPDGTDRFASPQRHRSDVASGVARNGQTAKARQAHAYAVKVERFANDILTERSRGRDARAQNAVRRVWPTDRERLGIDR